MTRQKTFKARVRARMDKTGERYTAARAHLADKRDTGARSGPAPEGPLPDGPPPPGPIDPEPTDSAETAQPAAEAVRGQRFQDEIMRERTGRGWDEWFGLLDGWGATTHTHGEIAAWLVKEHDVPGWWAQTVAVGYEQARDLRAPGQRHDGIFSATGTRTVAVPVEHLFEAFNDPVLRQRWLPGVVLRVRTATAPKSWRADWKGGPSRLVVGFTVSGPAKSRVAIEHERLPDSGAVTAMKDYWRERLGALKQFLEE